MAGMNKNHFNVAVYFISSSGAAFLSLVMLVVYTHALDAHELGKFSMFQMVVTFGMPLMSLSLATAIGRQYVADDQAGFRRYFSSCFWLTVVASLAVALAALALQDPIASLLQLGPLPVFLALICALAQGMLVLMTTMNSIQRHTMSYAGWRLGSALALNAGALYALYMVDKSWMSLAVSQALVSVAIIGCAVVLVIRKGWLRFVSSGSDMSHAVRYSAPLIVHTIASMIAMHMLDRLFISHYLGISEVGIYHVAQQLSMVMWMLVNAVNLAWVPWYYEQMKDDNMHTRRRVARATYLLSGLMAVATIVTAVALWIIFPHIIDIKFMDARSLLPWLVLGYFFNALYCFVSAAFFHFGHTSWIAVTTVATACLTLLFNALLVPAYGMTGAAIGNALSMFGMFVIVLALSVWKYGLPFGRQRHIAREAPAS